MALALLTKRGKPKFMFKSIFKILRKRPCKSVYILMLGEETMPYLALPKKFIAGLTRDNADSHFFSRTVKKENAPFSGK